jgi:mannose-6-phosphate isomerase-like protein (cupin superfamily)
LNHFGLLATSSVSIITNSLFLVVVIRKYMEQTPENVRPWGRYDIIETGPGYQIKRIEVKPGKRLSYQSHEKRAEYWIVVAGTATVTLDDVDKQVNAGESIMVPIRAKHRATNLADEPMVFIEVQTGDYLGEDDIVRYEDDYGREGTNTPHGE